MDKFSRFERRTLMSRVKGKDTKPEMLLRRSLHRLGYRFRLHRKDLPGSPDIVLPKFRTAIFVNGCFWHGHDCPRGKRPASNTAFWNEKLNKNEERDQRNYQALKQLGWHVEVVWECEIRRLHEDIVTNLGQRLTERP